MELRKHFPTEVILEKRVPFLCQNTKPDLEQSVSETAVQMGYVDLPWEMRLALSNLDLRMTGAQ